MDIKDAKILIVEDNVSFSLEIEMLLEEFGVKSYSSVDNSAEALEMILDKRPTMVLMDINIKGKLSGIQVAKNIEHLNIPIIFITSYDDKERFEEARTSNMAGYLIKPVNELSLKATMLNVLNNLSLRINSDIVTKEQVKQEMENIDDEHRNYLFVKKDNLYIRLKYEDIYAVEAYGNYSLIYSEHEKLVCQYNFSKIEHQLSSNMFMKVHRSHVINLKYLKYFDKSYNTIVLTNDIKAPVSRQNKQKVMAVVQ